MPYTLLRGEFVIRYPDLPRQGPEPDGDTVKFRPDAPGLVEGLPRPSGTPPDLDARGISVRLEAIDALEIHFGGSHQELAGGNAARDALLALLGFTGVRFFDDLPGKVASADQDALRGHVLAAGIEGNGRLVAFAYPGDHPGPDGASVFVDEALADRSVNARLLAAGHAYPGFYTTLPVSLRRHLALASTAAREVGAGLWPRSTADPDGPATIADLAAAQRLVIWPKLFRRIVPYLAAGFADFDGFDAWLRADPVNRDDALFLVGTLEPGNLHDVVHAAGHQVRLTRWPEEFVIVPDPPAPGAPTGGTPLAAGDVLILAALADPVGADQGRETVTLLNTTASSVDLSGWALVDRSSARSPLAGTLAAGAVTQVSAGPALRLGNQGGALVLVDGAGRTVDHVAYTAERVRPGRTIAFGR
ncbi:MAG TPA: lamin tail domain-containing protein [Acidimicrobiales bacterium]|nr:lamin tail domain-containing protein [Acidimicrobiales bacterium]